MTDPLEPNEENYAEVRDGARAVTEEIRKIREEAERKYAQGDRDAATAALDKLAGVSQKLLTLTGKGQGDFGTLAREIEKLQKSMGKKP